MYSKKDIEYLKNLIPDYITGMLDDKRIHEVSQALTKSTELRETYNDMNSAAEFISNTKLPEPDSSYWTGLVSDINSRIELLEKPLSGRIGHFLPAYYKYLAIAAVILIFFIAYMKKEDITEFFRNNSHAEFSQYNFADSLDSDTTTILKVDSLLPNEQPEAKKEKILKRNKNSNETHLLSSDLINHNIDLDNNYLDNNYSDDRYLESYNLFSDDIFDIDDFEDLTNDEKEKLIEELLNSNL